MVALVQVCVPVFRFYLDCTVATLLTVTVQLQRVYASLIPHLSTALSHDSPPQRRDSNLGPYEYEARFLPVGPRYAVSKLLERGQFKVDTSYCDLRSIRASRIFFSITGDTLCTTLSRSPRHKIGETLATQRTFILPFRKWLLVTVKLRPKVDTNRPCGCTTWG
jgi:hypothetical protein